MCHNTISADVEINFYLDLLKGSLNYLRFFLYCSEQFVFRPTTWTDFVFIHF
jgi:hypothetical protein